MGSTISLAEARDAVCQSVCSLLPPENVPLLESLGRALATEVRADVPWPTTDRSAMDGFAVYAAGGGLSPGIRLPVVGESLAGHPFAGELAPGGAVRIMTGAVVPEGTDSVVPVEETNGYGGDEVTLRAPVRPGQNVRKAGSEVAPGDVLLPAGRRIRAAEVGALAVLGMTGVPVSRRPRVAILSTGDEVVPVDHVPEPHQLRDSNTWALSAQIAECGGEPSSLGIAADDAASLRAALERGLREADLLLTIGGVSRGTHDLVHGTLRELGVQQVFHGIALKPGKPTFFGRHGPEDAPGFVFGLPGNPASCTTVFDLLVRPLLLRMQGTEAPAWDVRARLSGARFRPNRRTQALPARLYADGDGNFVAEILPPRPSGDPFTLLPGTGYALIPPEHGPEQLEQAQVVFYGSGLQGP